MSTTTLEPDTREKTAISEKEIEEFLDLMTLEPEAPCEFPHNSPQYPSTCSGEVVVRVRDCRPTFSLNICENAKKNVESRRETHTCRYCKRPAKKCWYFLPI